MSMLELIYYGGTCENSERTEKNLSLQAYAERGLCNLHIESGVGTVDNSRKMAETHKRPLLRKALIPITTLAHSIRGYSVDTHIAQSTALSEAMNNDPNELMLMGHSRGAAVGITGIINQWYIQALALKEQKGTASDRLFSEQLESIHLLLIDPVSGPDTNENFGKTDDFPPIHEMLRVISEVAEKPNLFEVTCLFSRYDPRKLLELDPRWITFSEQSEYPSEVIHTGFRHNSSVATHHLDIYPEHLTPDALTKAIIEQKLGLRSKEELYRLVSQIEETELTAIDRLTTSERSKQLDNYTKLNEWGTNFFARYFVAGKPLRRQLKKSQEVPKTNRKLRGRSTLK